MPKKIENPLREGLQCKIYFLAFPEPISRYAIANIIHGRPTTSHISVESKKMIERGYLKEMDNRSIFSNITPLVTEIEKDLEEKRKIKLTDAEKSELTAFLDNQFRAVIAEIELPKGDVNAYYILTNSIGFIAHMKKIYSSVEPDNSDTKEFFQAFAPDIDMDVVKDIKKIPLSNSLIEKLEMFAPRKIIMATEMAKDIGNRFADGFIKLSKDADNEKKKQHTQT